VEEKTIKCDVCGYDSEVKDNEKGRLFIQSGNIHESWDIDEDTGLVTCPDCG
jgi:hypothetical protein